MEFFGEIRVGTNSMKWIGVFCFLAAAISLGSYFGLNYYRSFHIVAEIFSAFIAFSILMLSINTYELSKNIPFLFLGIAFGFAGGFNVIHILSSNGTGFFQGDTTNLSMIISIIQRYITSVSVLVSYKLFYKSYKNITPITILLVFSILSSILLLWVFKWGSFPSCYIPGQGNTVFKIVSEYIISAITVTSIVVLFRLKKYVEYKVFIMLQLYFFTFIFCNILLTFYITQQEITNVMAHILKVIAYYLIYRAIVKVGIKTPYKSLFNELNWKDNSLKLKNSELEKAIYELQKENQLRRDMEELFIKNEASYRLLIENSRDAIIIYNDKGIVFANQTAASIVGIDNPKKLLGKLAMDFFKINKDNTLRAILEKRCGENTIAPSCEVQVDSIDGTVTPVEINSVFITYHNKPAILSLISDISSNKRMEQMKKDVEEDKKLLGETLEFNRLITEFFSNISHELRTPLNVILSALQVLRIEDSIAATEEVIEKRSRYIEIMKQNCYRLLRLISNLIDITRIDSGYVSTELQNDNIVSIVENITLSVAEYVENKGVGLVFDTNVEEKNIACDPDKIERIMLNLISNAVKFTEKGDSIKVSVFAEEDSVQICVKDTGLGIPEDKLLIIFERFRQVDNSLSRNNEGSGIGLSLVKALVELHGGNIMAKSTLGEGSEFIITLPVKEIGYTDNLKNKFIFDDNDERISIEFSDIYS